MVGLHTNGMVGEVGTLKVFLLEALDMDPSQMMTAEDPKDTYTCGTQLGGCHPDTWLVRLSHTFVPQKRNDHDLLGLDVPLPLHLIPFHSILLDPPSIWLYIQCNSIDPSSVAFPAPIDRWSETEEAFEG